MAGNNRYTEEQRKRMAARRAAESNTNNGQMRKLTREQYERLTPEQQRQYKARIAKQRQMQQQKANTQKKRADDEYGYDEYEASIDAKKKEKKALRKRKYKILLIVEIVVVVLVAIAAFAYFYLSSKWSQMNDQEIQFVEADIATNADIDSNASVFSDKYTTIMLYGVDSRSNDTLVKDTNADTEIVVCLNNETGEVNMVSVMRDTALQTASGKLRKVTDSYCANGVKESIEMMNRNLDLTITKYITVNWKAVIDAINILGGIDVEIKEKEVSQINYFGEEANRYAGYTNWTPVSSGAGVKHLDGAQAVGFARVRNVNRDGDSDDFARTNRQRIVIEAMLKAAKSAGLGTIKELIDKVMPGIATNITFEEALGMATNISKYSIANQGRFPFEYKSGNQSGMLYPNTLTSNVSKMHEILFGEKNYSPSSTVKKISDEIAYAASR